MIGWDLILEYAVGSMTVAVGWSGYFQRILAGFGMHLPAWMSAAPGTQVVMADGSVATALFNLPAMLIVLAIMVLLVVGVRESARFNAAMVAIKLVAVVFFIVVGVGYVNPPNWSPFAPYGWSGIMTGAAVVFFAYIGFDAVSTTAEEAKNPARDLPIGIIASLVICTLLYLIVAGILSGIVPVVQYKNDVQFLNAPVGYALVGDSQGLGRRSRLRRRGGRHHQRAARHAHEPAAHLLLDEPRPAAAGRASARSIPRFRTPYITTIITCVIVALVAGFVPIQILGEMTSIGTLVRLRHRLARGARPSRQAAGSPPPLPRAVRIGHSGARRGVVHLPDGQPLGHDVGALPRLARPRHADLLVLRPHAQLAGRSRRGGAPDRRAGVRQSRHDSRDAGDASTASAIALLGFLTTWGVTSEAQAKWSELDAILSRVGLHISAEIADKFGLAILGIGIVILVVGLVLRRSAAGPAAARRV